MSPALKTLVPGIHTSVQDFGRAGYRHLGVPTSGALDRTELRLANLIVQNPAETAGLEILVFGPTFEVLADSVRVAVSGRGNSIEILTPSKSIIPAWQSVTLQRNHTFRVNLSPNVMCCYLAIEGGLDIAPVMGSLSTYSRAAFGGLQGRALLKGDEVPLTLRCASDKEETYLPRPPGNEAEIPIRITWGQQADYFTKASLEGFVAGEYSILPASDRMGYRLSGFNLEHKHGFNIVSDGTALGAIQVPGDGFPIILLADCQTTGGYPKIATVISSDLGSLARRGPGSKIRFKIVSIKEAEAIARQKEEALRMLENTLLPVGQNADLDLDALYDSNLISGIYDANNLT